MNVLADGKVTINTALDNNGFEKGLKNVFGSLGGFAKTVTKTATVITAAFATAAVAITKQAVDAYAEYEQLVGGIETLFKNSASKVQAYAEDAFYTAGMSANEYMQAVTSFSASLISSLAGDTEKAADVANMAMIDMSDNANKMGTEAGLIQNAYQGFAKQNYTMLDNLKLGYGGTKTEMERLLKDAEKLTGVKYDISNLADVYSAIHAIQEELGVAGATAKEAEKTITGAANMTKAAWKNVLSAISGGGDLDKAINNLVYSISKYFENIVPVVERSLAGIGRLIEKVAPQLVQTVATALIKALPSLLNAVYQMIIGLAKGIYQGIVALFTGSEMNGELTAQLNDIASSADAAADAEHNLAKGIEAAEKAAEKSLAGFDELNKLSAPDPSENAADVGGVSGNTAISAGSITVGGEIQDNFSPAMRAIIEKIRNFANEVAIAFQPSIEAWKQVGTSAVPAVEDSSTRISMAWNTLKDTSLKPFSDYIVTDFIPSIVNTYSETFAPILEEIMPVAIDTFTTDFENNCLLISKFCTGLETSFEGVKKVFADMCESISANWDTYGGSLLDEFTEFKEGSWQIWWDFYYKIIEPVLTSCGETFGWLWDKHLKPLWDDIVEFVLSVGENLLALWNGCLKPIIDLIVAVFAPAVVGVVNQFVDWIGYAVALITDLLGGIITFLDGLIQFIVGVFTLDWKRAWGGIVKMFEGLWNGIVGIVKGVINTVIWTINALIAAIYSAIAGIVNGLGSIVSTVGKMLGKDWGFSIPAEAPKIPYLAQGAVLPANKPFLAMVGDQKHGTNIEAPLTTIQEAVAIVMEDMIQSNIAGHEAIIAVLREILEAVLGVEIGDDTIAHAVARYNAKMAVVRGG